MKSKITEIKPYLRSDQTHHSTTNDHGTLWYFIVNLEDGTKGNVRGKSQNPRWKVGDEVDYEIEKKGNFTNLKLQKPFNKVGKPQNNRAFALAYAKDIYVANIGAGHTVEGDPIQFILEDADKFIEWLEK